MTGHIWGAGNSIVSFGVQGLAAHSGQQGLGSLIQLLIQCGKSGNALDPDIGRLLVEDLRILALVGGEEQTSCQTRCLHIKDKLHVL